MRLVCKIIYIKKGALCIMLQFQVYDDLFNEQIVKRKKNLSDMIFSLTTSLAVVFLMLAFIAFPRINDKIKMFILPFIAVGGMYVLLHFVKSRNLEFEYSITNGDLDITQIIDQKKRTLLCTINCREIELMGMVNEANQQYYGKKVDKIVNVTSGQKDVQKYFILCRRESINMKIYFEPNEAVLKACKKYVPSRKFLE